MMAKQNTYIAIDLKSFYASVECKERNRDPLTTNLVVADKSRTEKTICLAVSPSLKRYGIPGRPRLFEVVQKVKEANNNRRWKAPNRTFTGSSDDSTELNVNPALEIDYRMPLKNIMLYPRKNARMEPPRYAPRICPKIRIRGIQTRLVVKAAATICVLP